MAPEPLKCLETGVISTPEECQNNPLTDPATLAIAAGLTQSSGRTPNSDTSIPTEPTNLQATAISKSQIDLSWTAASDNLTIPEHLVYEICQSATPGYCSTFVVSHSTPSGSTTLSLSNLLPLTTYYFKIRTRDEAGNISVITASEVSATTFDSGTLDPPGFSPVAGSYPSEQLLYLSSSSPSATICYTTDGITEPKCSTTTFKFCTSGSRYTQAIQVNTSQQIQTVACESGYIDSQISSATYKIDTIPPSIPGNLQASATGDSQILLSWLGSSDNLTPTNNIVYEICVSQSTTGCDTFSTNYTTPPGATTYNISGLSPATTYYFRLRARDEVGHSGGAAPESSATTLTSGIANSPYFTPTPGSYLTQQNVSITSGTAGATICYTTNGVTEPACNASAACLTGSYYTTPLTVANNQTIKAIACKSGLTDSAVTTGEYIIDSNLDTTPPTFAGVESAIYNSGSVDLTWQPATDNNTATSNIVYDIYQASGNSCHDYTLPTYSTTPGATGFTVPGIAAGDPIFFVVRARDEQGNQDNNLVEKSASDYLLYDGFENRNCGWVEFRNSSVGSAIYSYSDQDGQNGTTYSIKVRYTNSSFDIGLKRSFAAINPSSISIYLRPDGNSTLGITLSDSGSYGIILECNPFYDWITINGNVLKDISNNILSCSPDTWNHYEISNINWGSNNFDVWLNGVQYRTAEPLLAPLGSFNVIEVFSYTMGNLNHGVLYDELVIR